MKQMIKHTVLLLMTVALAGCQDWLDVSPKSEVRGEDLFTSEEGFQEALTGVYIGMANELAYGSYLSWNAIEFMAWQHTNSDDQGSWYDLQRHNYTTEKSLGFVNNVWSKLYNVIGEANYLLYALDEWGGDVLTPALFNTIKGEALAVRAYCHFDLMRLFAEGNLANNPAALNKPCIPYVKAYSKDITPQVSYSETVKLLMDDINEAAGLLSENEVSDEQYHYTHFDHRAVLLLKARVALWANDPNTYTYANELTTALEQATSKWAIDATDYTPVFLQSEVLFGLSVYNLNTYMETAYNSHSGSVVNRDMLRCDLPFITNNMFEFGMPNGTSTSDVRFRWYEAYSNNSNPELNGLVPIKVRNRATGNEETSNAESIVPLMRLSEAYLIAAEASIATNKDRAVQLVNFLRTKRNVSADYHVPLSVTAEELKRIIMQEYRREFTQEGQIFFCYKRMGVTQIPGSLAGDMTEATYLLPYPVTESEFGHTNQ